MIYVKYKSISQYLTAPARDRLWTRGAARHSNVRGRATVYKRSSRRRKPPGSSALRCRASLYSVQMKAKSCWWVRGGWNNEYSLRESSDVIGFRRSALCAREERIRHFICTEPLTSLALERAIRSVSNQTEGRGFLAPPIGCQDGKHCVLFGDARLPSASKYGDWRKTQIRYAWRHSGEKQRRRERARLP